MSWSKRDVISGTGTGTSKGGYMIGTDQRGDLFIDALRDTIVTAGLGATMLTGLQGNVAIPKLATKTTVAFVAETSAPTEGAPVFDLSCDLVDDVITEYHFDRWVRLDDHPA